MVKIGIFYIFLIMIKIIINPLNIESIKFRIKLYKTIYRTAKNVYQIKYSVIHNCFLFSIQRL